MEGEVEVGEVSRGGLLLAVQGCTTTQVSASRTDATGQAAGGQRVSQRLERAVESTVVLGSAPDCHLVRYKAAPLASVDSLGLLEVEHLRSTKMDGC